jgi:hypothetical protein
MTMKLTAHALRKIIREELRRVVERSGSGPESYYTSYAEAVMAAEDDSPEQSKAFEAFVDAFEAAISDEEIVDPQDPDLAAIEREISKALAALEVAGLEDPELIDAVTAMLANAAVSKKNEAHWAARNREDEERADGLRAAKAAKEEKLLAAAKSLLLDPERRKEIVPILNAKRREKPSTKAGKAASAAVTDYIEGVFPELDALDVHRRLTNLVDQMYGRR